MDKIQPETIKNNRQSEDLISGYSHLIAVDWSRATMALARMTSKGTTPTLIECKANVGELRAYLKNLHGRRILTFEETTTSHWLYLELHDSVERIIICDPYRNRLLSEGPKNDKIDAAKLCRLLKAGLLKEVYHTLENDYQLRKIVSAYEDIVKAGVRFQNQRSAFYRAEGKDVGEHVEGSELNFVLDHLEEGISWYDTTKESYEQYFHRLCRTDDRMKRQRAIPGIGIIGAVKIVATVIDARRFPDTGHYLSYCGLVKHQKMSGGQNYGQRSPRFDHTLKSVYKTAALAVLGGDNPMKEYYEYQRAKGVEDHNARRSGRGANSMGVKWFVHGGEPLTMTNSAFFNTLLVSCFINHLKI
jgi:transposase